MINHMLQVSIVHIEALTPSHSCLSYYGANGKFETDEFKFEEA